MITTGQQLVRSNALKNMLLGVADVTCCVVFVVFWPRRVGRSSADGRRGPSRKHDGAAPDQACPRGRRSHHGGACRARHLPVGRTLSWRRDALAGVVPGSGLFFAVKGWGVGDTDDQAVPGEEPGHRLSPRLGARRVEQFVARALKLAASRGDGFCVLDLELD